MQGGSVNLDATFFWDDISNRVGLLRYLARHKRRRGGRGYGCVGLAIARPEDDTSNRPSSSLMLSKVTPECSVNRARK